MELYLTISQSAIRGKAWEEWQGAGERKYLTSFFGIRERGIERWPKEMERGRKNGEKSLIMLDSGAYSSWTRKETIGLGEYIQFCLENLSAFNYIVSLDVIPGSFEEPKLLSQADRDAAAAGCWKNYKEMLAAGIPREKLLLVFHQGESFSWLKRMVEEGVSYIGLEGNTGWSKELRRQWYDQCMTYVLNSEGWPRVRFHGVGLSAVDLISRYPWFSCNTTRWRTASRMGIILVPGSRNDYWNCLEVVVSRRRSLASPTQHFSFRSSFFHRSYKEQEYIVKYLEEIGYIIGTSEFKKVPPSYELQEREQWAGDYSEGRKKEVVEKTSTPGVSNSYLIRDSCNIKYFIELEKRIPGWPWQWKLLETISKKGKGFGLRRS